MTEEELSAKIAQLEAKNAELEAKIPAPVVAPDPDEAYKPATWKENRETTEKIANDAALKVLQEAEAKKEAEKKKQDEAVAQKGKEIDEAFAKLQEEGILLETKDLQDAGAHQRRQILASLVRSGGQHVDVEARKLKSAWDAGLEYDDVSNSFKKSGTSASPTRDTAVASSAGTVVSSGAKGGPINVSGIRGDLDEARRRYELANGKV